MCQAKGKAVQRPRGRLSLPCWAAWLEHGEGVHWRGGWGEARSNGALGSTGRH